MAEEKTNVMRILDQKRVPYTPHPVSYTHLTLPTNSRV